MNESGVVTKRDRGTGRIFVRGRTVWIQYQDTRHRQIRETTGIQIDRPDWEKAAAKKLRKKIGAIENDVQPDNRALRYEDLRSSYMRVVESGEDRIYKSLRRDAEGRPFLEAVRRLDPFFEGCRAVDIDADRIREFHKSELERGSSHGTINRSVSCLRRMFRIAQKDGKLSHAPFFPMLAEAKPRGGTLSSGDYPALLAELPEYLRPVIAIAFRTGMRLGEILGLTWDNVNWMDHLLHLPDTKNDDSRDVPFSAELEAVLRERYAKRQPDCDRVCFRIDRRGHARAIGNFRKLWRRACVKLGLGKMEPVVDRETGQPEFSPPRYPHSKGEPKLRYTGLIVHDLRRSFVTDAEHAGAPRHEVMMITGHKSESVYKRYAIGNTERRHAALKEIERYRSERVEGHLRDNLPSGEVESSLKN